MVKVSRFKVVSVRCLLLCPFRLQSGI